MKGKAWAYGHAGPDRHRHLADASSTRSEEGPWAKYLFDRGLAPLRAPQLPDGGTRDARSAPAPSSFHIGEQGDRRPARCSGRGWPPTRCARSAPAWGRCPPRAAALLLLRRRHRPPGGLHAALLDGDPGRQPRQGPLRRQRARPPLRRRRRPDRRHRRAPAGGVRRPRRATARGQRADRSRARSRVHSRPHAPAPDPDPLPARARDPPARRWPPGPTRARSATPARRDRPQGAENGISVTSGLRLPRPLDQRRLDHPPADGQAARRGRRVHCSHLGQRRRGSWRSCAAARRARDRERPAQPAGVRYFRTARRVRRLPRHHARPAPPRTGAASSPRAARRPTPAAGPRWASQLPALKDRRRGTSR